MLPTVKKARKVREYDLGLYIAALLTDCVSVDKVRVEYVHMLVVYDRQNPQPGHRKRPAAVFTAETNPIAKSEGQYFLCAYYEGVHANFGHSPHYRHLAVFEPKALEKAREHLQITESPQATGEIGSNTPLGRVTDIVLVVLVGVGLLIGAGLVILVIAEFLRMFSGQPTRGSGSGTPIVSIIVIWAIIRFVWRSFKKD